MTGGPCDRGTFNVLGCYGCLATFRGSISVPSSRSKGTLTLEFATDSLCRNVDKKLPARCITTQKKEEIIYTAAEASHLACAGRTSADNVTV